MSRGESAVVFHVGAVPSLSRLAQRFLARNAGAWSPHVLVLPNAVLREQVGSGQALADDPAGFAAVLRDAFADPAVDTVVGTRTLVGPAFNHRPGAGLHAEADRPIEVLADATRSRRRRVVLSVCPQADLLELHFAEVLAGRGGVGPAGWLDTIDLDNLSWLPLHDKLVSAFGGRAVTVCRVDRSRSARLGFLRDLAGAAGLDMPGSVAASAKELAAPPRRLSRTGVAMAIAADPLVSSAGQRADLRDFLLRHFSDLDGPPGNVLTAVQAETLRERYAAELEILGAAGGPPDRGGAR